MLTLIGNEFSRNAITGMVLSNEMKKKAEIYKKNSFQQRLKSYFFYILFCCTCSLIHRSSRWSACKNSCKLRWSAQALGSFVLRRIFSFHPHSLMTEPTLSAANACHNNLVL